jgi:transposase
MRTERWVLVEEKEMLKFMERTTIYYLKQKGWSNVQIAEFTGHHRDTIAKVLKEDLDQKPKKRDRKSAASIFDAQIQEWIDQDLPVVRMFELARADQEHPYTGSETAFYDYVRKTRRRLSQPNPASVAIRFEGMPGEYLQIDWGEVRNLAIANPGTTSTRYFFAARDPRIHVSCLSVFSMICERKPFCVASLSVFG